MNFQDFQQLAVTPRYWCGGSPLNWTTEDPRIGLALFAQDGRVGMFNLCWWMLQRSEPPPTRAYYHSNLQWVIMRADAVILQGQSLVTHASFKSLQDFKSVILRYTGGRSVIDRPGDVPWATLARLAKGNT